MDSKSDFLKATATLNGYRSETRWDVFMQVLRCGYPSSIFLADEGGEVKEGG